MAAHEVDLDRLQRWMQAVITHPDGVPGGLASADARAAIDLEPADVRAVVRDLPDVSAPESLAIYARMYRRRLIEALEVDYPALRHHLGRADFADLAGAFVDAHPSRFWTLNRFGRELPEYLALERGPGFAAEVAALERTIGLVKLEQDAEVLTQDELLARPPEAWPELLLAPVPALRLCRFEYPVEAWYRAWRRDEAPETPAPAACFVAVYRHRDRTWRVELTREQHALLTGLAAGLPLGEAIEAAAAEEDVDLEALGASLSGWFQKWSAEGFFQRLDAQGPTT